MNSKSREPNSGIPEAYAEGTGSPIKALYEQKDPLHTYEVRPGWSLSENIIIEEIYRKSKIPSWLFGRLFDKKVAKILYVSDGLSSKPVQPWMIETPPLVTEEELTDVALRGRRALLRNLEREMEEGRF